MISFLLAAAPFLPVLLQVAGFFINMFGASQANILAYQKMVDANQNNNQVSVDDATQFAALKQALLDEQAAKAKRQAALNAVHQVLKKQKAAK